MKKPNLPSAAPQISSTDRPPEGIIFDTNFVLRLLLGDDPAQSPQVAHLVEHAPPRSLRIPAIVVAEVIWHLRGNLQKSRSEICEALQNLFELPSISASPTTYDALERFINTRLDFTDCLLAAQAHKIDYPVGTFDRGFGKFRDIIPLTPLQALAALQQRP